ncbi:MAG TPA: ABC transporter ATP-binding protein [Egibacteraceae bacterium]|nr:ABC transporter ATP-binding protein [Egibacteraceae bacterium]
MSTVVDVDELSFRYPRSSHPAVEGLSFSVGSGEVFGFLGPNGAGKSTTQGVLTARLRGFAGRVRVLGRPLQKWRTDYYERIGVAFEQPAHFGKLTARENLEAFASLYQPPIMEAMELLALVDLAEAADVRARELSKGMQMRLTLARALVHRPEVLFLDEPTAGLDPVHAAQVRTLIKQQAGEGRTIFLTTHDMRTADELCDRVAFIVDGRITALNAPRALKLVHGQPAVSVEYRVDGALERAEFPLDGLGENPAFLELLRNRPIETVHSREASLDDVFAAVTGRTL